MNVGKANLLLPSSSLSPAPKHRTSPRDLACLPSPPPTDWNAASASITSPNAPAASTLATTPYAAPMTLSVAGAQANIYPPITPARPEKTPLKDDHARTRLLSVLLAPATMTPVSPNAHRALPPPMFIWFFNHFPPLAFLTGGSFQYFGCVISSVTILMWMFISLPFLPIVAQSWGRSFVRERSPPRILLCWFVYIFGGRIRGRVLFYAITEELHASVFTPE
jgi:hypothetical protein